MEPRESYCVTATITMCQTFQLSNKLNMDGGFNSEASTGGARTEAGILLKGANGRYKMLSGAKHINLKHFELAI